MAQPKKAQAKEGVYVKKLSSLQRFKKMTSKQKVLPVGIVALVIAFVGTAGVYAYSAMNNSASAAVPKTVFSKSGLIISVCKDKNNIVFYYARNNSATSYSNLILEQRINNSGESRTLGSVPARYGSAKTWGPSLKAGRLTNVENRTSSRMSRIGQFTHPTLSAIPRC